MPRTRQPVPASIPGARWSNSQVLCRQLQRPVAPGAVVHAIGSVATSANEPAGVPGATVKVAVNVDELTYATSVIAT